MVPARIPLVRPPRQLAKTPLGLRVLFKARTQQVQDPRPESLEDRWGVRTACGGTAPRRSLIQESLEGPPSWPIFQ